MSTLHGLCVAAAAVMLAAPAVAVGQVAPSDPQPRSGQSQDSRSAPFAVELTQLLESMKLNNVAAKSADQYVGASYQAGVQLIVVAAKLSDAERMNYLIAMKEYREAYRDLNTATMVGSRILINDLGANGLRFKREKDQPFDMVDIAGKSTLLNGEWGGKEKPSRDEYTKTFETTDDQYAQMLQALIAVLKKPS